MVFIKIEVAYFSADILHYSYYYIFTVIYVLSVSSAFFSVLKYGQCIADVVEGDPKGSKSLTSAALFLSTVIPTVVLVCLTPLAVIRLFYQPAERIDLELSRKRTKDIRLRSTLVETV